MNDLSYVAAAYIVVLGGLLAYAISLVRRGRAEVRRLTAIEFRRDHPAIRPEAMPATENGAELDPRSP